jgi:hypothetical protein
MIGLKRLFNKVIGAILDRRDSHLHIAMAADYDHGQIRIIPAQAFHELQSIQLRSLQPDIQQHQRGPPSRNGGERGIRTYRRARLISLILENAGNQLANIGFVINNKNVTGHHAPL